MNPKVSIIIPAYNSEKYLQDCLDSVRQQSHKNLEIIIINDGSTDQTQTVIDRNAREDARIKIVRQINAGVGAARNAGLDLATGDFISFIDSDDTVDLSFVEKLLSAFKPGDAYVRCATVIGDNTVVITEEKNRLFIRQVVTDHLYDARYLAGLRFRPYHYSEDLIFNYELSLKADNFSIIDDALYFYRKNPDSISSNWGKNYEEIFDQMRELVRICPISELNDDRKARLEFAFVWYVLFGNLKRAGENLDEDYIRRSINFVEEYFPDWPKNKYIPSYIWDIEKLTAMQKRDCKKTLELFQAPIKRWY